tara:strand:+ start:1095 stop:1370 length:276 start_codon:yes stop_codon:yes gene_type:complete
MGFIADIFSGLFGGGGQQAPPPPPPTPIQAPAVSVTGSGKSKKAQMDMRRRMARSGQSSLNAGGSYGTMGGVTTGTSTPGSPTTGKTLMGG